MSGCSNQFPKTDVLYSEISSSDSIYVAVFAGICCLMCVIILGIFLEEIWFIMRHYPLKPQRNKFITILGLFPVVCFMSTLATFVPTATLLCDLVETTYLSICILLFVNMLMSYFGGKNCLVEKMSGQKIGFNIPPICCFRCLERPFNRKHLRIARIMTNQITLVRPIALFLTAVLWTDGRYIPGYETNPTHAAFYLELITVGSAVFASWGLSVMFKTTRSELKAYRINAKFICFQFVLFFMNVQSIIIGIFTHNRMLGCEGSRDSRVRGYRIHHNLLVLEMFLLSFIARYAYRRTDPDLVQHNIRGSNLQVTSQ